MIINRLDILNSGKHMTPESGFTPDGGRTEISWELRGQVMLTSTFQPWVILATGLMHAGLVVEIKEYILG